MPFGAPQANGCRAEKANPAAIRRAHRAWQISRGALSGDYMKHNPGQPNGLDQE